MSVSAAADEVPNDHECDRMSQQVIRAEGTTGA
jgi:hypothetical protein